MTISVDELVERLRKFDWFIHTSEGPKQTDIPLKAASQLIAMKEAVVAARGHVERTIKTASQAQAADIALLARIDTLLTSEGTAP